MHKYINQFLILITTAIITRFIAMIFLPLSDTTEARYANTALMMAKLNDWITPFYKYNEPFLGKPPFAFWFEAISYKIFGIADLVPRVPSLLITLATLWLIYKLTVTLYDKTTAVLTSLIYMTSLAVFILSGVVMTDPFLVFGTTLSLISFLFVLNGYEKNWRYLFFVGAGIAILTKGPLGGVVIGGVITLWILLSFKQRIQTLKKLPWVSGILLMLLVFLPWYIAQEIKNPGFLYYFIIGENLGRFLNSGWSGDKYGYVHKEPKGMIWVMWVAASLPWGLIALAFITQNIKKLTKAKTVDFIKDDNLSFYLVWALFIMLFFTVGGNVLWYYVLPSMGGFAILLALYLNRENGIYLPSYKKLITISSLFIPTVALIALTYVNLYPTSIKTEKYLIDTYKTTAQKNEKIYFVGKMSFSTIYYIDMGENIDELSLSEFKEIQKDLKNDYFIIINKDSISQFESKDFNKIYSSKKYILLKRVF